MTDRAILNVTVWQLTVITKGLEELKNHPVHRASLDNLIAKVNDAKVFKAGN